LRSTDQRGGGKDDPAAKDECPPFHARLQAEVVAGGDGSKLATFVGRHITRFS